MAFPFCEWITTYSLDTRVISCSFALYKAVTPLIKGRHLYKTRTVSIRLNYSRCREGWWYVFTYIVHVFMHSMVSNFSWRFTTKWHGWCRHALHFAYPVFYDIYGNWWVIRRNFLHSSEFSVSFLHLPKQQVVFEPSD